MKNYYEILEVDKKATKEIIKAVYKTHIKKKHPDLFQGVEKKKAEEQLKIINKAYETLSDEQKRSEYDKKIEEKEQEEKSLLDELMQENAMLRAMLEEENLNQNNMGTDNNEQIFGPKVTEQRNKQDLKKLIWKERILKLIFVVTMAVAAIGAIYKLTGKNILISIFNAFVHAIFGE